MNLESTDYHPAIPIALFSSLLRSHLIANSPGVRHTKFENLCLTSPPFLQLLLPPTYTLHIPTTGKDFMHL